MKALFCIFISLNFLIGCAPESKVTKTKISLGASTTSSDFPGGLYILAYNPVTRDATIRRLTTSELELELPNGRWEFGAIGFDDPINLNSGVKLAGQPKCFMDRVPRELNGVDLTIGLNVSTAGCGIDPFNSEAKYQLANGSPKPLRIISCGGLKEQEETKETLNAEEVCSENKGNYKSYKFVMHDIPLTNEFQLAFNRVNRFESACISVAASTDNVTPVNSTGAHPPIFEGIPQRLIAFEGLGCTGNTAIYDFPTGMKNAELASQNAAVVAKTNTNDLYLDNPLCDTQAIASSSITIGSGTPADPKVICNGIQLNSIAAGDSDHYILGRSISGAGYISKNNFSGHFDGLGFAITGLQTPLFNNLIDGAVIENLKLFNVNISKSSTSGVGALVGQINLSSTGGQKVEVENIHIYGAQVSNSSNGSVGGAIGMVRLTTCSGCKVKINDISISNSLGRNQIRGTGASVGVGGAIGHIESFSSSDRIELEGIKVFDTDIETTNSSSHVGGAFGKFHYAKGSDIQVKNSTVGGRLNLGGVAGFTAHSELNIVSFSKYENVSGSLNELNCNFDNGNTCSSFGGIVGRANDNTRVNHAFSEVYINDGGDNLNKVGGIAGEVVSTSRLNNTHARVDFKFNGNKVGGIVGELQGYTPEFDILSSYAEGKIDYVSLESNTINQYRGGIAGKILDDDNAIRFSGARFDVLNGQNYLGGAVGWNAGVIEEIFVDVTMQGNSASDVMGNQITATVDYFNGVILGHNDPTGRVKHSFVTPNSSLNINGAQPCNSNNSNYKGCGLIAGKNENANLSSNLHPFYLIGVEGAELNGANTQSSAPIIGGLSNNTSQGLVFGLNLGDPTDDASAILVNDASELVNFSTMPWINDGTTGIPTFFHRWNELGRIDGKLRAGNMFDPFLLSSASDWNKIQADAFYLNKVFALNNDLDFSGGFIPIGVDKDTSDNLSITPSAFTGAILASDDHQSDHIHKIRNVRINSGDSNWATITSTDPLGMILRLGKPNFEFPAIFGTSEKPIYIENIEIQNQGNIPSLNVGGIAGISDRGVISVDIEKVRMLNLGSSAVAGGLVGESYITGVYGSKVTVDLDASGTGNVGGLIGNQYNGTNRAIQLHNNTVDVIQIKASAFAGGLVGIIATGTPPLTDIGYNEVIFQEFSNNLAGTNVAGFIAALDSKENIYGNYVEIKPTNLNGSTEAAFLGGSPTGSSNWVGNTVSGMSDDLSYANEYDPN